MESSGHIGTPVRQPLFLTKKDVVAETLRNEILSGKLPAGSPIQQDAVAQRLEVSATPVREAFRMLEVEGLLESRPHHGVVVARHDFSDVDAIYEMRALVEPFVLRHAAKPINAALLAELHEVLELSERLLGKGEAQSFRRASLEFHKVLARAAGPRALTEFTLSLISRAMLVVPLDESRMSGLVRQHTAIAEALDSQRISQAANLLQRHLDESLRRIRRARPAPEKDNGRSRYPQT